MAKLAGAVVVNIVVVVVVALMIIEVVMWIGFVAAVVVLILMTSGRLFKMAITTIPAMHVARNITNHTMILQVLISTMH